MDLVVTGGIIAQLSVLRPLSHCCCDHGGIRYGALSSQRSHSNACRACLNDGLFSETMDFRDFPSVLSAVIM